MNPAPSRISTLRHQVRARPRLLAACAVAVLTFFALPAEFTSSTRALVTWDVGALLYLILAWVIMARASLDHMTRRARMQDDGAAVVLFLTVAAAVASIAAIVLELSGLKTLTPSRQSLRLALVAVTFVASWMLVHTSFALHYAHAYYISLAKHGNSPLKFPGKDAPVYMDFLYFAMVVGMTSQTADIAIASSRMRRLAMAQGIIAFAFNTTLLALTVNIAASLLG
ncbi:conserved membrane hypothetical protein [Candidatus Accumulibacter aalborgensis]|uniref:Transmembrane protein n=1 Tax=Candidatus Accumulibacter aalborgensis TaxID=1860102 RepID=A0A1A8XUJ3_9PROT|nr:DUF1345 domain-containing protein [Candidatus Accumulibacter aalborgensis]SBT08242.1 conserved membrane hypothetical protein [Candidatus Accumulibacter aalborgensis]